MPPPRHRPRPVSIRPVETAGELRAFVDLPYRLHRDDPIWIPPLRIEVRARLSRTRNPFFRHADAEYFLAEREGQVVGRIASVANRRHDALYGDAVAFFGFFECVDDDRVAGALIEAAADWAAERGYALLRGPVSLSTNDECGLLVEGYDRPPTLMTAHNPPYYARLLEAAGFAKAKDLFAWEVGGTEKPAVPERLKRAVETLRRRTGIELRAANRKDFDAEVRRLHLGYNLMWERNWGFVPMTEDEFTHAAKQLKPIFVPELAAFAERRGETIGVALAVPDVNEVLRRHRAGRLLPAAIDVLWSVKRKRVTRLRILMLGVKREYQRKAVDAMLYHRIWERAVARGMTWGEASWVLEDNAPMNNALERMGMRRYKVWRLYDRML